MSINTTTTFTTTIEPLLLELKEETWMYIIGGINLTLLLLAGFLLVYIVFNVKDQVTYFLFSIC